MFTKFILVIEGQVISKWNFGIFKSPKKPTKPTRAENFLKFGWFLGDLKTPKFHSEIKWPLKVTLAQPSGSKSRNMMLTPKDWMNINMVKSKYILTWQIHQNFWKFQKLIGTLFSSSHAILNTWFKSFRNRIHTAWIWIWISNDQFY